MHERIAEIEPEPVRVRLLSGGVGIGFVLVQPESRPVETASVPVLHELGVVQSELVPDQLGIVENGLRCF